MSKRARFSLELRARRIKLAELGDRARRKVHRKSYWRKVAAQFPLAGVTSQELSDLVENARSVRHKDGTTQALPGLRIEGGHGYYGGLPLGEMTAELATELEQVSRGARPANVNALLAAGLAVQTRSPSPNATDFAIVVSPHLDDGSLSLGGVMLARRNVERHFICNVFTVSSWLGKDFGTAPVQLVSALREAEERLSLQALGAFGIGLGLWDAEVRNYHRMATERYEAPEDFVFEGDSNLRSLGERDSIHQALDQLLKRLEPKRIYFPLGLGNHIDHEFLRDLGKARVSSIRTRYPNCQVFFYEDMPYATYEHIDIPPVVSPSAMGGIRLVPEVIDITAHFEGKIQAIAAHRSQFRRSENEDRLRDYAGALAREAGLSSSSLAERIWRAEL